MSKDTRYYIIWVITLVLTIAFIVTAFNKFYFQPLISFVSKNQLYGTYTFTVVVVIFSLVFSFIHSFEKRFPTSKYPKKGVRRVYSIDQYDKMKALTKKFIIGLYGTVPLWVFTYMIMSGTDTQLNRTLSSVMTVVVIINIALSFTVQVYHVITVPLMLRNDRIKNETL